MLINVFFQTSALLLWGDFQESQVCAYIPRHLNGNLSGCLFVSTLPVCAALAGAHVCPGVRIKASCTSILIRRGGLDECNECTFWTCAICTAASYLCNASVFMTPRGTRMFSKCASLGRMLFKCLIHNTCTRRRTHTRTQSSHAQSFRTVGF